MNKICLLFIASFCLLGCNVHSTKVSINGEIKGLGNDTIYIYGTDELSSLMDTIYVQKNKFSHTLSVDTIVPAMLLFSNQKKHPIYLEKGNNIEITGDINHLDILKIGGNILNEELTTLQTALNTSKLSEKELESRVETFIRQHDSSIVSIYLLKKYFVEKANPDLTKIKQLIALMNGELRDNPYIDQLSSNISKEESIGIGKPAPFFSMPNANGKRTSLSDIKGKYILLNFWASWNDARKDSNYYKLRKIYQSYKKNKNFTLLSISLDVDKASWKETIKKDTLIGEQLCDFSGWESYVIKQYAVKSLPTYYLISPDGKIMAKGEKSETIIKKMQETIK
ncbi:TlpA disulfide reductase family protein [uncultured Bacteroides sp.]|uniref:TlpA disulfide reductase family protein n=1 Tax=uncultured Bacteroides sp. TaxID=162156 RepID=UPI002AA84A10|nr:TlpA disulfide reductase family protein [uncultured Bacteroides sp.]